MIIREDFYCPYEKKSCRRWQKNRNECFLDSNRPSRISIFLFGCSRFRKWEVSE
jgi:hypothetical protein